METSEQLNIGLLQYLLSLIDKTLVDTMVNSSHQCLFASSGSFKGINKLILYCAVEDKIKRSGQSSSSFQVNIMHD